jgi:hypothetical protein
MAAVALDRDPARAAVLLGGARAAADTGPPPTLPGFEPLFAETSRRAGTALGPAFEQLFEVGRRTARPASLV